MHFKSDNPKISIITPSFNQGQFIADLIQSIEEQDYTNYEHIIMDGGSTDDTVSVLKNYAQNEKIIWESEPDKGQTDAINKAWEKCSGEIINWINSDDWFEPDAFKFVIKCFLSNPSIDVVYGHWYISDINQNHLKLQKVPDLNESVLRHYCPGNVAIFFKRSVFEKCIPLDIDLRHAMDLELILKAITSGARFYHSNKILASMRRHLLQKGTVDTWEQLTEAKLIVAQRYLGGPYFSDYLKLIEAWIKAKIKIHIVDPLRSFHKRSF